MGGSSGKGPKKGMWGSKDPALVMINVSLKSGLLSFAESFGIVSRGLYGRSLHQDCTAEDIILVAISDIGRLDIDLEFIEGFVEGLVAYRCRDEV
mmetsp:Transcript_89584/g.289722  ORF Transcript_89584/g.289722 Transcript_89584/m.289722 type:complete len:95 (-) Transcript_89584:474-758(-)